MVQATIIFFEFLILPLSFYTHQCHVQCESTSILTQTLRHSLGPRLAASVPLSLPPCAPPLPAHAFDARRPIARTLRRGG